MATNSRWRICWSGALLTSLAACATFYASQYPDSWPPLDTIATCGVINGTYINRGVDQASRSVYLDSLFADGTDGTEELNGNVDAVRLDVLERRMLRRHAQAWMPVAEPWNPAWKCDLSAGLSAAFVTDASGEGSIGVHAHVELTGYIAQDRSLIFHLVVRFRGGVPTGGGKEYWIRFEPISN